MLAHNTNLKKLNLLPEKKLLLLPNDFRTDVLSCVCGLSDMLEIYYLCVNNVESGVLLTCCSNTISGLELCFAYGASSWQDSRTTFLLELLNVNRVRRVTRLIENFNYD